MPGDDGASDGEPEAEAAEEVFLVGRNLLEWLENAFHGRRIQADAVVAHFDTETRSNGTALRAGIIVGTNVDVTARRRKFHRVAEQIPKDLLQSRGITSQAAALGEPCDTHSLIALVVEIVREDAREKAISIELELAETRMV